jgi:hypothetical protein
MIERKSKQVGVFSPSEVALLGRVFERTAVDSETDEAREDRASRIIANYKAGITDEDKLVEASKLTLGR